MSLAEEIIEHVQNEARYVLRIEELEERLEKAAWERDRYREALEKYRNVDNWLAEGEKNYGAPLLTWHGPGNGPDIANEALNGKAPAGEASALPGVK